MVFGLGKSKKRGSSRKRLGPTGFNPQGPLSSKQFTARKKSRIDEQLDNLMFRERELLFKNNVNIRGVEKVQTQIERLKLKRSRL